VTRSKRDSTGTLRDPLGPFPGRRRSAEFQLILSPILDLLVLDVSPDDFFISTQREYKVASCPRALPDEVSPKPAELSCEPSDDFPQMLPQLPLEHLSAVLRDEYELSFTLPFRVLQRSVVRQSTLSLDALSGSPEGVSSISGTVKLPGGAGGLPLG